MLQASTCAVLLLLSTIAVSDGRADPWQLLTMNGADPGPRMLREYASQSTDRETRPSPTKFDITEFILADSVRLTGDSRDQATYEIRLKPTPATPSAMTDALVGELSVSRPDAHRVTIRIRNRAPVTPATLVKITEYSREIDFEWSPQHHALLRKAERTSARGKAFGFSRVSRVSIVTYLDFDCGNSSAPADLQISSRPPTAAG